MTYYSAAKDYTWPERRERARVFKDAGNNNLKQEKLKEAYDNYEIALAQIRLVHCKRPDWDQSSTNFSNFYDNEIEVEEDSSEEGVELLYQIYANLAQVCILMKNWKLGRQTCDFALKIKKTAKVLYRKAICFVKDPTLELIDEAICLLKEANEIEP